MAHHKGTPRICFPVRCEIRDDAGATILTDDLHGNMAAVLKNDAVANIAHDGDYGTR